MSFPATTGQQGSPSGQDMADAARYTRILNWRGELLELMRVTFKTLPYFKREKRLSKMKKKMLTDYKDNTIVL